MSTSEDIRGTGALAQAIADVAIRTIGPNGTIMQVDLEDAAIARATFIANLAEAAITIANGSTA